jgi:hypothetical protein
MPAQQTFLRSLILGPIDLDIQKPLRWKCLRVCLEKLGFSH